MPTVSVDLDPELHAWLRQRARDHDSSTEAELAALAAAARSREQVDGSATDLPVGVYDDTDETDRG